MRNGTDVFRGEFPHLAPEKLPDIAAQEATNCRLENNNLQSYRQFALTKELANTGTVRTIYLHTDPETGAKAWLSFNQQVDIAKNVIEEDPTGLLLLTCPDLYDKPQYTTYDMATAGAEPYPVAGGTLPLGVPGPSDIPVLVLGVDNTPTTFSIDVLDEGDGLETNWVTSTPRLGGTFSSVVQEAAEGDPSPCYRLRYDEIHNFGEAPWARRNFGIEDAATVHVTAGLRFSLDAGVKNGWIGVATTDEGEGVLVGVNGGTLQIRNSNRLEWYGSGLIDQVAAPGLVGAVWYTLDVTIVKNPAPANTQTVTAKLLNGATVIAEITATNVFSIGGNCFITAAIPDDSGSVFASDFDNIHVQASGSTGITPNLTATSYVYTFVIGDLGWESAPSLATADILRPDGVVVTVTTSTTAPAGYSEVDTKRIYRVVSAPSGDLFLLVAEIPLAQSDFVDNLKDNEIGPTALESQDFDLPHPDMEGIINLPNEIYAGFFGKQLCLSATGWPHAWPIRFRLACESTIVAIKNIGNTIVVGTKSAVYTCTGTEPGNYVMSEAGSAQACTSKLGMVYLDNMGVVFPSPDGYQLCTGSAANVRNMTEEVFTKRQWQALDPSSVIASVYDGILHFYWRTQQQSAETVLMLWHMTSSAGGEGLAEFSFYDGFFDQTAAEWAIDANVWDLVTSSPAPKFGDAALTCNSGGSFALLRNASQDTAPDNFPAGDNDPIAIEMWVYRPSSPGSGGVQVRVGSAYPDFFVLGADDFGTYCQFWGTSIFMSKAVVPSNQWVHLRLTYDGDALRLFQNGAQVLEDTGNPGLTGLAQPIATMQLSVDNFGSFGDPSWLVDEVYAVLGTTIDTGNFTPPAAPWPNP